MKRRPLPPVPVAGYTPSEAAGELGVIAEARRLTSAGALAAIRHATARLVADKRKPHRRGAAAALVSGRAEDLRQLGEAFSLFERATANNPLLLAAAEMRARAERGGRR